MNNFLKTKKNTSFFFLRSVWPGISFTRYWHPSTSQKTAHIWFHFKWKGKRTSINLEGKKAIHFFFNFKNHYWKMTCHSRVFVLSTFIYFTFIPCQCLRYFLKKHWRHIMYTEARICVGGFVKEWLKSGRFLLCINMQRMCPTYEHVC